MNPGIVVLFTTFLNQVICKSTTTYYSDAVPIFPPNWFLQHYNNTHVEVIPRTLEECSSHRQELRMNRLRDREQLQEEMKNLQVFVFICLVEQIRKASINTSGYLRMPNKERIDS